MGNYTIFYVVTNEFGDTCRSQAHVYEDGRAWGRQPHIVKETKTRKQNTCGDRGEAQRDAHFFPNHVLATFPVREQVRV